MIILLRVPVTTRAYHAGAIARCRFAGRCAQGAWHHGFNRDFLSSSVYAAWLSPFRSFSISSQNLFCPRSLQWRSAFCFPRFSSASRCSFLASSFATSGCYLKPFSFSFATPNRSAGPPPGQCSSIILLRRDSRSFWSCFRITGRGFSPRAFRIDHLQVHGAHPALRHSAYLYPGDDHHADAGHLDVGCNGLPMCLLYESCIWIAWFMEHRSSKSIAS